MNSVTSAANALPEIQWTESSETHRADWRSESGMSPPRRVVIADDTMTADTAYRLACEGTGLLWRGDFQNARQLLQALVRRVDRPSRKSAKAAKAADKAKSDIAPEVSCLMPFTAIVSRSRDEHAPWAWCSYPLISTTTYRFGAHPMSSKPAPKPMAMPSGPM